MKGDQKRAQEWLFGVMRAQTWLFSEVNAEGRSGTEKRGRGGLGEVLPRGEHGTSSGSSWHLPEDAEGEKTGEDQEGRRHSASRHRGGQDAMLSLRWFGTGLAVALDGETCGTSASLLCYMPTYFDVMFSRSSIPRFSTLGDEGG